MTTIGYNTPLARTLAGLAVLWIAGFAQAEEAGIVRLTDLGDESMNDAAASKPTVVRGQSDLRRRNARTAQALRQLFRDGNVRPAGSITRTTATTYNACDCCPAVGDACCPPPVCAAPAACCPPPVCAAPVPGCLPACDAPAACCDAVSCCPDVCDGCNASGRCRIGDVCPRCGGQGCPACRGRRGVRNGQVGQSACRNGNSSYGQCQSGHCSSFRARNYQNSARLNAYLRCKLGYFIHDGSGGIGSPLFGHYKVVYPVDPGYFDDRDGQVYAAQGYGGPVSVPLAPTVRHAYNYGWGIPSSRLTPISNTLTP